MSGLTKHVHGFLDTPERQQHPSMGNPRQRSRATGGREPLATQHRFLASARRDQFHGLGERIDKAVTIGTGGAHQPDSVHLPLLSTTTSRSLTFERNDTTDPSFHISVTMVSPGKTGAEKRTSNPVIIVWS